jgi:hypothetical protein
MIFFFVPETKQRTLEELDYIFAVPGKKFIAYQTGKAAPWWFKRWILWQRDAKLGPLYVSYAHSSVLSELILSNAFQ